MGRRRKNAFMSDGDSSGDSSGRGDDANDQFDPDDEDAAAERELFKNPYATGRGKKRTRDEPGQETNDWGQQVKPRAAERGRKVDYTRGQAFVSAGTSGTDSTPAPLDNLSTSLSLEEQALQDAPVEADDEDMDMEDSDIDSSPDEVDEAGEEDEYMDGQQDIADEDDLAPVPGLAPPPAPDPIPANPLAFAPRVKARGGIGAKSSAGSAGIGAQARAGLGSTNSSSTVSAAAPVFASATSASNVTLGGLGNTKLAGQDSPASGSASPMTGAATPRAGLGARSGIGSGVGMGIGARPTIAESLGQRPQTSLLDSLRNELATAASKPSKPDDPARPRRSFLPTASPSPLAAKASTTMSTSEKKHFAKLATSGSLGLKMLEKMGWKSGTGLGADEQGIVTPIGEGTKLRAKGVGLAFGGKGERSAGALAEGKRRGEVQDDDEDKTGSNRKGKKGPKALAPPKPSKDAWQQPTKKKEKKGKMEYKSYEQIVAEAGGEPDGVGMLVDLSGNALSSQSLSSLPAFGAGSADPTRLPELRHNLTLLTSTISSSLSAMAREGKGISERRAYLDHEEARVRQVVDSQARALERLKGIMLVVESIKQKEAEVMEVINAAVGQVTPKDAMSPFIDEFDELLGTYGEEYEDMKLDEVVIAAVSPILRRLFIDWDPLSDPAFAVSELKRWKRHFMIDKNQTKAANGMDIDVYGAADSTNGGSSAKGSDRTMTAYETMLWTIWLPKVRSSINNAWSPSDPATAVNLFTAWSPLLPIFLRDNMLDQLILPKLSKAISDWSPSSMRRGGAALHTIVFPWLEHAGERMDMVLEESKRKIRSWLKGWKVAEGVPTGMDAWKQAFSKSDWDSLLLKHVLPQLGTTLRDSFSINPRAQDLKPLEDVLAWRPLMRSSMMDQLLEGGFFVKWLEALYIWLTHEPNFDQVAEWYMYWKSYFAEDVLAFKGVTRGFKKGLELMNQASTLGDDAKYRLKRPDTSVPVASAKTATPAKSHSSAQATIAETSFRSIAEEFAAAANLLFLPTGRAHERGYPLFRVSNNVDGKSGVTVYLENDVVWLSDKNEWKPISLEDMVTRASKG